jgi:prepilin peptidase CpaA
MGVPERAAFRHQWGGHVLWVSDVADRMSGAIYLPLALVMSTILLRAAWCDFVTRLIPDTLSLLLVMAGVLSRLVESASAVAVSAGAALLLFCLLTAAYSRGWLGGGDVKLMTALAVGFSPIDSYRFVVATAIAGGVLGILYLFLSRLPLSVRRSQRNSRLGRILAVEAWRIRRRGPLPYGVAIAVGGTFVLFHPGSL